MCDNPSFPGNSKDLLGEGLNSKTACWYSYWNMTCKENSKGQEFWSSLINAGRTVAEDLVKSTSTKTFFEHRTVRSKRKAPRQWEKNEFEWWLISNLFQLLLYSTPPPCQFCLSHASALCSALPCSYSLERVWLELSGLAMITTTGARGRELWARTLICHSLNSLFSLMVSIKE